MCASTESIPFLSIKRRAALETRRRTQRFSVSTQTRRHCRFGRNLRLVLLLAWETLLPTLGFLPVTSQTRSMMTLRYCLTAVRWALGLRAQVGLRPHLARKGGGNPSDLPVSEDRKNGPNSAKLQIIACCPVFNQDSCSRKRWASSAAMQPVPALVIAWRYTWS